MPLSLICKGSVKPRRRGAEMLSGIITAILLALFIVGWFWAWSPRRKQDFDAAARLPLDDLHPSVVSSAGESNKERAP